MSLHILRVQARLLKHTSRHLNLFYPFTRISPYRVTSILSNQLSDQRRWSQTSTIQIPLFVPTKPVSKEKREIDSLISQFNTGLPTLQSGALEVQKYATRLHQLIYSEHLNERKAIEKRLNRWEDGKLKDLGYLLAGMRGKLIKIEDTTMISFYKDEDLPYHIFKRGDIIRFYRAGHMRDMYKGIVYERGKNYLYVISLDKPEMIDQHLWRLERFFSDLSYEKMRDTLVKLCALSASSPLNDWYDPRVNTKGYLPHPDIIIINKNERNLADRSSPLLDRYPSLKNWEKVRECVKWSSNKERLSKEQLSAIGEALKHPIYAIQGAAGTGKTKMIAHIADGLRRLEKNLKILVCAHSNIVVDQVMEHMERFGLKTIRIGASERMRASLHHTTLAERIKLHRDYPALNEQFNALKEEQKIKDIANPEDIAGDYAYDEELKKFFEMRDKIIYDVINQADIVCATCIASGHKVLREHTFHLVMIDNASQCTESEALVPIVGRAMHVILFGDTTQLRPHIEDEDAATGGLSVNIFQRMLDAKIPNTTLTTQYRMHPMICRFSNIAYYERKIKSFPSSKKQKIPVLIEPQSDHPDINPSVIFVDFGKYNLHEYRKAKGLGKSFAISKDVEAVISIVILLINKNPDLRMQDIGIIAAGREQKRRIQSVLKTAFSTDDNVTDLQEDSTSETEMETEMETETDTETNLGDLPLPEVDTIEGFQSREKPVIIFVATYIDQNGEIEWVKRRGRVNVGLTRAQRLLIVVGPGKLLEEKLHWNRWISWMRKSYTCPEIRYTSLAKCKAMLDQS